MFLPLTKPITAFGAAFVAVLSLGFVSPAEAAPPPGMRWSDTVGFTSPRSQYQTTRVAPSYIAPQSYSYAPMMESPAVVTSTPAQATVVPAPATVAIRGPDGIVRTYSVEGGVVQQNAPAFVSIRGADGVVRSYPVVSSPAVVPGR
jgi:hypothetical protein